MFALDAVPPILYAEPWAQTLPQRLRMLVAGRVRVAYFYELADTSTFRYRAYNMAQVLNASDGRYSASYFFLDDVARFSEVADAADLLVVCRVRYDQRVNALITAFRKRRKRVLFDVDDLVFDIDYAHLVCASLDKPMSTAEEWNAWYAYSSRLGATLRLCDGAVTTNSFLADRIREFSDLPVTTVPNFLNREQMALSEALFDAKYAENTAADGRITFGYFSGSPTHNRDFALAAQALAQVMADDARIDLVLVGYIEAGPDLQHFGSRVRRFDLQDFMNLQRLIASVDFNLMPLQYNAFTNCKSELKYFEAAIAGTQSIASPSFNYARAIEDGVTGYVAQAHQWHAALARALADMPGYWAMARRSSADARRKYAWFHQQDAIAAALGLDGQGVPSVPGRASTRMGSHWGRSVRPDLPELHASLRTHTSDKWSSYLDVYARLFAPLRDAPVRLLEIGVQNGGSLDLWRSYFAQGRQFVGCDIDARCAALEFADERVQVVIGDATRPETHQHLASIADVLDIVIDDGSHRSADVLAAFCLYFPMLRPGGVYCVEDTHTLYWPEFGGGIGQPHGTLAFFRLLTEMVDIEHRRDGREPHALLAPFFAGVEPPPFIDQGWVQSLEFHNSMIVIHKALIPGHGKRGKRLIVGNDAVVDSAPLSLLDGAEAGTAASV